MNTTPKTLGQILLAAMDTEGIQFLPIEQKAEYAARAVRDHILATEMEEGWRLLEPDSVIAEGDQFCHRKWRNIWNFAGSAAIGSNVGTKELVRRRCRLLKEQPTTGGGEHGSDASRKGHDSVADDLAAKGPTPEGGDYQSGVRTGLDKAIARVEEWIHPMSRIGLVAALKRERDAVRAQQPINLEHYKCRNCGYEHRVDAWPPITPQAISPVIKEPETLQQEPENTFLLGAGMGLIFGLMIGGLMTLITLRHFKVEAIQHNAATWKVNPDGTTEFQWREDLKP